MKGFVMLISRTDIVVHRDFVVRRGIGCTSRWHLMLVSFVDLGEPCVLVLRYADM